MPTNRTRRARAAIAPYSGLTAVHLGIGDCLCAGPGRGCACGLRDENGVLLVEVAAAHWAAHRDEILRDWAHPYATFAQVLFEQAPLVPLVNRDDLAALVLHDAVSAARGRRA
jgi:hypothetical protein